MEETTVTTPDGNEIVVQHPEGASKEQILRFAKQQYKPQTIDPTDPFIGPKAFFDVGKTALSGMAGSFLGGLRGAGEMMTMPPNTPFSEAMPRMAEVSQRVQDNFTRPPSTPEGQLLMNKIAPGLQAIDTGITDAFGAVPGPPGAKAAARTVGQGAFEILGLGGLARGAKAITPSAAKSFIPEIDDLYNIGRVAFNEARINGSGVRPEALSRVATRINEMRTKGGTRMDFDPILHPQAHRARERILSDFSDGNIDFDELLTLREIAGDVAGNKNPAEAARGVRLKSEIDEFVNKLKPDDVLSGDPERAAQALKAARAFWRDASAARTIQRQIDLADNASSRFSGSGAENALRSKFAQLSDRITKGYEKGFTPDEIALIKKVADGTPIGNAFRTFGKLSPTGIVSTAGSTYLGSLLGGPVGVAGVLGLGLLGRGLATRSTKNLVKEALQAPLKRSLIDP